MKALIIGGARSGEWIDTLDGAKVWLDIVHADTYLIRRITWTLDDGKGAVREAFHLHLAIHPEITAHPQEQALATQMMQLFAMAEFARTHGEPIEIPTEPSAVQRANGAAVLGPNGLPLS